MPPIRKPKVVYPTPLPHKLVRRLQSDISRYADSSVARKTGRSFDRTQWAHIGMKNIDDRKIVARTPNPELSNFGVGERVREMNISRTFPGVKLVIKRNHFGTAADTIRRIRKTVNEHNSQFGNDPRYKIVILPAEALNGEYIAMPKVNAVRVSEIINFHYAENYFDKRTARGKKYFQKLKKEFGVTEQQLKKAAQLLQDRTETGVCIHPANTFLLGLEDGRFVFMSHADTY
jgi:hypothetical protein